MRKVIGLFSILAIAGCGSSGPSFGAPVAATTSQKTAATTAASTIDTALAVKTNASSAQTLADSGWEMLSDSITPTGKADKALTSALSLVPSDSGSDACIVTNGTSGWTYNNCSYGGYTINGSITYTDTSSIYHLTTTGNYGGYGFTLTENGSFTWTTTHFGGSMTVSYVVSGLPAEAGGSINFGGTITWDVNYSGSPACISSGYVEVDGTGLYSGGARYVWTACNTYLVSNAS